MGDADDPWLSDSELGAWMNLIVLLEALPANIDAQLKRDVGVNLFEYTILAMLSEEPSHHLAMTDLASVSFGSLSRLSHAVTRLEDRGWVERRAGSGGRRHNEVVLTDEGLAAVREAAPRHAAHAKSLISEPLSEDEVRSAANIFSKLIAAADPDLGERIASLIPEVIERNQGSN